MSGLSDPDADAESSLSAERQSSLSQQVGTSHRDRAREEGCSPLRDLLPSPTTSLCRSLTGRIPAVTGRLSEQPPLALPASTTEKDGEGERTEIYEHKAVESNVCARARILCKGWVRKDECLQKEGGQNRRCQSKNTEHSQLQPSSGGSHLHYGQSSQHLDGHEREEEPAIQNAVCAHHEDPYEGTDSRSPAGKRGQPSGEPGVPVVMRGRGEGTSRETACHSQSPSSSDPTPYNGDGQEELPWVPRSGDLVELRPREGGRDCSLIWKGEVICVYEDPGRGSVVDLLRFNRKGVSYRNPYAGLLKAVDVNSLRLVQRSEDRFESRRGTTDNLSGSVVGFSLHPPKFTVGVDPDLGALCFFWDLETTGLDTATDEITEIGCVARLFRDGRWQDVTGPEEREGFAVYVHTSRDIPPEVQALTRITKELLREKGTPFNSALIKWFTWIRETADQYPTVPIWFAAHNGSKFDIKILLRQEQRHGTKPGTFLRSVNCSFVVDTLTLSRALPWRSSCAQSHSLGALYSQLTGKTHTGQHTALGDSRALAEIVGHQPFLRAWQTTNIGISLQEALEKKT